MAYITKFENNKEKEELIYDLKKRYPWREYIIVSLIITVLSFFIHIRFNNLPNFEGFFIWLPITWLFILVSMIFFVEFLREK